MKVIYMKPDEYAIKHAINTLESYQLTATPIATGEEPCRIVSENGTIVYQSASSSEIVAYAAGLTYGSSYARRQMEK